MLVDLETHKVLLICAESTEIFASQQSFIFFMKQLNTPALGIKLTKVPDFHSGIVPSTNLVSKNVHI